MAAIPRASRKVYQTSPEIGRGSAVRQGDRTRGPPPNFRSCKPDQVKRTKTPARTYVPLHEIRGRVKGKS